MGLTNYSLKTKTPPTEPPQPLSNDGGEGGAENSNSLDKLVEAIYNSVTFAQRKVETEHLGRVMSTYFDNKGNAKTFRLNLPGNNGELTSTDVPLITLASNSHLAIDELEMELSVNLGHFEDEINNENNKLCAEITGPRGHDNLTKIKIKMKSADTPEGLAKVNDQLIKILPT
jgi:hypothetical protein